MKKLKICYIDDFIDNFLSEYLDRYQEGYYKENYCLEISEYNFKPEDNYKSLLTNQEITSSSILLIDSRLFENMTVRNTKFTGEQFLVILKKVLPFIRTIIVTQNEINKESVTVSKYKKQSLENDSPMEYYNKFLKPLLDQYLQEFIDETEILEEMGQSQEFDVLLLESLNRSIIGLEETTIFEKNELDELINVFNEVKEQYEKDRGL